MGWDKKTKAVPKAKEDERIHIMIGVPIEHGSDGLGIGVYRFLHCLQELNQMKGHRYRYSWQMVIDKTPVEWARNLIVGMFLKSDAQKLWFIDNDMIPPDNALSMLDVTGDIIAGMAMAFDHGNKEKNKRTKLKLCLFKHHPTEETFMPVVPETGQKAIKIDAAGTATMLIDRKVLEDRRLWGDCVYKALDGSEKDLRNEVEDPDWGPPIFRFIRRPNGHGLRGEDIDFSWRAKQLGYEVIGCPGIRFGHNKNVNLDTILDLVNQTALAYGQSIMEDISNADKSKTA